MHFLSTMKAAQVQKQASFFDVLSNTLHQYYMNKGRKRLRSKTIAWFNYIYSLIKSAEVQNFNWVKDMRCSSEKQNECNRIVIK